MTPDDSGFLDFCAAVLTAIGVVSIWAGIMVAVFILAGVI